MADKKPETGSQAALIAHLHVLLEEIRTLRREFRAATGAARSKRAEGTAADTSERRKDRKNKFN